MNKGWIHIFDNGACLTRRQIKDYVAGTMINEECHAVEVHLNSCDYCADAMSGIAAGTGSERVDAMMSLDRDFLAERFGVSHPEVHLNSIASAATTAHGTRRRGKFISRPLKTAPVLLVLLVFGIGLLWYANRGNHSAEQLEQIHDVKASEVKERVEAIEQMPVATTPAMTNKAPKPAIKATPAKAKTPKGKAGVEQAKHTLLMSSTETPATVKDDDGTKEPEQKAPATTQHVESQTAE